MTMMTILKEVVGTGAGHTPTNRIQTSGQHQHQHRHQQEHAQRFPVFQGRIQRWDCRTGNIIDASFSGIVVGVFSRNTVRTGERHPPRTRTNSMPSSSRRTLSESDDGMEMDKCAERFTSHHPFWESVRTRNCTRISTFKLLYYRLSLATLFCFVS